MGILKLGREYALMGSDWFMIQLFVPERELQGANLTRPVPP